MLTGVQRYALLETPDEAETLAIERYVDLWFTEDHREAEAAFAEKRAPVFKGK